jgi:hypothetical protein
MNNKKLQKENTSKLPLRTQALISIGGIQRDKATTPIFIKNIFKSSGHKALSSGPEADGDDYNTFYTPGTDINLDTDVQRIRDRIRFEEYGQMFQQGVEGRGFAFEGMLAGLFDGEPMKAGGKEDIKVGGDYYSIKQSNPGDAWDTGSLMGGYEWAKKSMEGDGLTEEEIPKTPVELMTAGDDYRPYKAEMLIESFKATNGQPLKWIFAHVLDDKRIRYVAMDSEELISTILSSDCSNGTGSQKCAVGKSRKKDTGVRIKSNFVLGADPNMITFPSVSDEDIRSIIYDPDGDRIEDKIRRIFNKPNKVSQYTVDYIRDNPKEFLATVNRELPNLTKEEKKILNNLLVENKLIKESYKVNLETMTPKLWSLIKLSSSMLGEDAFTSRGGSMIDFQSILNKYFNINFESAAVMWLIIQHNSQYYGISEKEVVELPLEKVKVPETIYETSVEYKGEYETTYEEDPCDHNGVGEESGEDCECYHWEQIYVPTEDGEEEIVDCEEASIEQKEKAGVDECECEEWEDMQIEMYYYPILEDKVYTLFDPREEGTDPYNIDDLYMGVINNFEKEVIYIREKDEIESGYEEKMTWDYFHDGEEGDIENIYVDELFLDNELKWLNRRLYSVNLNEETDIFGQGLLDPIDPEEFEGDDEEWEKMMTDTVYDAQTDTTLEPSYEYTGGTTDPSTGFVAPSAEVTNNICSVEGFCREQGPITFGQLKALVEEATSKRIQADMGRGLFKTLWRIVPFFLPQILLAAVGITVTRAINKIITPALNDTRGYKEWWGKVVLKAMDIAEGDYIPDIALGDDPLSKVFFISDGLLQMIRDKYKLKFARYVADVAASQPDNKPVPEWFVENLLRDYLNQKFLLDPPLTFKKGVELEKLNEQTEVEVTDNTKEDNEPFTRFEVTVLNYLAKQFTWEELNHLVTRDYYQLEKDKYEKYRDYLKYFGIDASDGHEEWAKGTRFAKWIIDNYDAAQTEDLDDDSLDYSRVTNPLKEWPGIYSVQGNESGWEQVYKSGYIDLPAWDEDDAYNKAEESFWEYEPEMETDDWGDYDTDDFSIDDSSITRDRTLREHIMDLDGDEPTKIDLDKFSNLLIKAVFTKEGGWGRTSQMFVLYITPSGTIKAIKYGSGTSKSSIPFKENEKVGLGSLIRFEKESGFDLRMKGRLRENKKIDTRINKSINKWVEKEYKLVLDHNNLPHFLHNNTQKLNTYNQVNNLVCEIWGKNHNYKLDVNNFCVENMDTTSKYHNNLIFENLTNEGINLPLNTLKHYLNKNIKEEVKDNVLKCKNINLDKLNRRLTKLGFIKEDNQTQKVVLEWLNDVIKETNKNGVITEEGKIKYVDNLIESYDTHLPHGLGVPQEVFMKTVETLRPEILKDLKQHINELMYYCLYLEDMRPEDVDDLHSMDPTDLVASDDGLTTVDVLLSDLCGTAYSKIWDIMRELERKLKNMGVLEARVKVENGERIINYYEDDLPESLVNLYTQIYSEIDQRLKSSRMGMPIVNKEIHKLTEDNSRAHSYSGGKHTNPHDVEVGDIIRLIHMNDPQAITVGSYGEVVGFDNDPWEKRILVAWDLPDGTTRNLPLYPSIDTFMVHKKAEQINEQDNQLNIFPIGQFEFTAHEDENEAKWLEKTVSDKVIKALFDKWDEDGVNLQLFKYLGIPTGPMPITYIVKRYIRNTKKPIPVSYTFECDDLKELFDRNNRDYDLGYIEEYLCGKDSFWDSEDWYNYEWDNYMTDQIDEENWKTISEIFGGVSQSVAEDMLNENSSSEEVDELIEKHQEDIDEIQNFIVWAHNDEHEYAVKNGMAKDIEDKLADHFQADGHLHTDNNGRKSWTIEGDLRDYVNDQWDNTETFEYHPDYSSETLEGILMDVDFQHYNPMNYLFAQLIEEEYRFWDYCEGKRGECLDVDTKFFDGYWHPNYDINYSLADRLGELTYEPQVIPPLKENTNIPHWDLYKLLSKTSNVTRERKTQIFDFLDALQNTGIINMFSAADFLWSGSKWLKKWLDLYNPELLEEPIEGLERGDEGYFDNERIKQAHYLLDNANSIRDTLIMMLIESVEDPESIRLETQMRPFAQDFVKLWMKLK